MAIQQKKIGYKITGEFSDFCMDGSEVGFEITFPKIYPTLEAAQNSVHKLRAAMIPTPEKAVQIHLFEGNEEMDVITFDQWNKYRCYRLKPEAVEKPVWSTPTDYYPYTESFEIIYRQYNYGEFPVSFTLQFLTYEISPAFIYKKGDTDKNGDTETNP